ncbi:MAG: hypothetical protein JRE23_17700, partial [Deltaproteobacteria bacterium]|nr:hypothetical protein [Deltaproteobacteria bacterium]
IGVAAKPLNSISASFYNCSPSKDCAKFCYATKGNAALATSITKTEVTTWAVENDPTKAAEIAHRHYQSTAESRAGRFLRLFDRGDMSDEWITFIKKLNKLGTKVQVFSKRPDLLRQIPEGNVRLLSVDKSNMGMAGNNPDLKLAFVYDGKRDIPDLIKYAKQLGVILPVKHGRRILSKEEIASIPKEFKKKICPLDAGLKKIGPYNCTMCDNNGNIGCFIGRKNLPSLETNLDKQDIKDRVQELRLFSGDLDNETRAEFLKELDILVSEIQSGVDPGAETISEGRAQNSHERATKEVETKYSVEGEAVAPLTHEELEPDWNDNVKYSVRGEAPPKKTEKAYKLLQLKKSKKGQMFPLFIDAKENTPAGIWLDAEFVPTEGYAPRPGWHFGYLPIAPHLMKKNGNMPNDRVWVEVEIAADVDWQPEADASKTKDLRSKVPKNGYYKYPRPITQGGAWYISGAMKITKIFNDSEVRNILKKEGLVHPERDSGSDINLEDWGLQTTPVVPVAEAPKKTLLERLQERKKAEEAVVPKPVQQALFSVFGDTLDTAKDRINRIEQKYSVRDWIERAYTYFADRMYPVHVVQKKLGKLAEKYNYLLAERLRGKVTADEIKIFKEERIIPLLKFLSDNGLNPKDLEELAYARHAPEANERLRKINARRTLDKLENLFLPSEWKEIKDRIFK